MKKTIKLIGIAVFVAVIGFSMIACGDDGSGGPSGDTNTATYSGTADGKTYSLKITKAARAITPTAGDAYELTVDTKTSTGTVQTITGSTLTLQPQYLGARTFNAAIGDNGLTDVTGLITFDDGDDEDGPGPLIPVISVSWTGLTANGKANSATTTALTLTFDKNPVGLATDNITVTGATKGNLSGNGTTRTLTISNITVAQGGNVTVTLTSPTGYAMTPRFRTVAINKAGGGGTVTAVSAGDVHIVAIQGDGTLWAWGQDYLGDGTEYGSRTPIKIGTDTNWASVSAGALFTAAIKTDGTLWAWGVNHVGQLGDGTTEVRFSPVKIGTDTNWASVVTGTRDYTVAIKTDGTLWAWGHNGWGQLGDGTTTDRYSPVQIGTGYASVTTGWHHTVAVKIDGTLWAWGYNNVGSLGDGTTTQRLSPVKIGTDTDWVSAAAGYAHTVAVKTDGTLWAWGHNGWGQLGDDTTTNRLSPVKIGTAANWVSVTAYENCTLGIQSDGTLWAWGENGYGQLGIGVSDDDPHHHPVQVETATNWASVAAGLRFTVATQSDGSVWAWGKNGYGWLGIGT